MAKTEVELILLRQWASYMAMPIWVMGSDSEVLYYNEAVQAMRGQHFDEAGPIPGKELSEMFSIEIEDDTLLEWSYSPINIAVEKRRPVHMPMPFSVDPYALLHGREAPIADQSYHR